MAIEQADSDEPIDDREGVSDDGHLSDLRNRDDALSAHRKTLDLQGRRANSGGKGVKHKAWGSWPINSDMSRINGGCIMFKRI